MALTKQLDKSKWSLIFERPKTQRRKEEKERRRKRGREEKKKKKEERSVCKKYKV